MKIKQFNDKALAHYSYAIVSEGKMALVDPSRNPMPYYQFAEENNAVIVAVFETHPHADFVSSHLQIHKETGATIYTSKDLGADYPHQSFDDGDNFTMGTVKFSAINTPGHSPDSISIVAEAKNEKAVFTGDTLFIGNVGRPDLREKAGNMHAKREELAKQMYHTMQQKYNDLPDETLVYPAHGAGSLCGKNMSDASSSTLGQERMSNWAFQEQTEEEFVNELLQDQPMIPHYFGFDVDTNKKGPDNFLKSIGEVPVLLNVSQVEKDTTIIDIRSADDFKANHLPESFNIIGIREAQKLETWLGAIVKPEEEFYVVVPSVDMIETTLSRIAKIGYEKQLKAIVTLAGNLEKSEEINLEAFKENSSNYTIVDIRNVPEVETKKPFENSINIPLHELRERVQEIPTEKPIVVHCAAGYRSAAGSSIIDKYIDKTSVLDLSDAIKEYL
ncbi:MBL fold metallo-hydrolase [Mesonia maritima]|uniref:Glyoxylase-like metal-dependent hydrolase (Beta-lactamase superfamily II)/rhodanese-related sulfurtransferase n=1 Tax=Mesonia maritima TaxID=1793873 RepID=A0ABU1K5J3_9FLAO|nr:MBL fold metallo-hydrolase [Mesonia maritima]MDR6300886.1 glyoxylase-like metal-dependent hydrolase (beta-lactamase superfamily II)/rhodanese-related sulfurtransferase [Mesonia maritima]